MKKNMFASMVFVFCLTFFFLAFLAGGLYIFDTFVRKNSAEAVRLNAPPFSKGHATMHEIRGVIESDATEFFRLKEKLAKEMITISFAGDLMFDRSLEEDMNKFGRNFPFLQIQKELADVDYAIVNLETAVTNRGTPYNKQYNFRTGSASLRAIKEAGFHLVSLANNHTMDYGEQGLLDTLTALNDIGLKYVGAGRNSKEAYDAQYFQIKGKKFAILGFSRVLPSPSWYATYSKPGIASGYQLDRLLEIIARTKKDVDYLFVYMHWGIERQQIPEQYQVKNARAMIDAGADGIIGAHPHVLQGLDYYQGKPIAYSLGNFLFPDYVSGLTAQSSLLTLQILENDIQMKYTPYEISENQLKFLEGEAFEERLRSLEKLSYNVKRVGNLFINPK